MANELDGRKVAFLVADGFEQEELTAPWSAVQAAGAEPVLVSLRLGRVRANQHLDRGDEFDVDVAIGDAAHERFDGLVLPGGVANPDVLRGDERAVDFVHGFFSAAKPVAVICHGPWTLIEADVVRGRTITSWPTLRTDLRNAGATWVDEEVVVDEHGPNVLVSSRKPDDLPAFCRALVEQLSRAAHLVT